MINKDLENYLKDNLINKKIAVIGNAVQKNKNGSVIDTYDIVFRFNRYEIKGYESYVGTKTDFWVITPYMRKNINNNKSCIVPKKMGHLKLRFNCDVVEPMENFTDFFIEKYSYENPTTGLRMLKIFDSLDMDVDVYGFDFWETGEYFAEDVSRVVGNRVHDFKLEKEIFKDFKHARLMEGDKCQ